EHDRRSAFQNLLQLLGRDFGGGLPRLLERRLVDAFRRKNRKCDDRNDETDHKVTHVILLCPQRRAASPAAQKNAAGIAQELRRSSRTSLSGKNLESREHAGAR